MQGAMASIFWEILLGWLAISSHGIDYAWLTVCAISVSKNAHKHERFPKAI